MAAEQTASRSRRQILAAALGGLGGFVAHAAGRPARASAATNDNFVLGQANAADAKTQLTSSPPLGAPSLEVINAAGDGVRGQGSAIGVLGETVLGTGVSAQATGPGGSGLHVQALDGFGATIESKGDDRLGALIVAQPTSGVASQALTAVQAYSGIGAPPAAPHQTGVFAAADGGVNAVGVKGQSPTGTGVWGSAPGGAGVFGGGFFGVYGSGVIGTVGDVDDGTGVQGWTGVNFPPDPPKKVGIWAGAEGTRTALYVNGKARFTRSGRINFSAGQASKQVTVPGGLTSTAFCLATIQANRIGNFVRGVVVSPSTSKVTIYLNKAVSSTTPVGWIVIG